MSLQDTSERRRQEQPANCSQLMLQIKRRYPNDSDEDIYRRFIERGAEEIVYSEEALKLWAQMKGPALLHPGARPKQPTVSEKERAAAVYAQGLEKTKERGTRAVLSRLVFGDKPFLKSTFGELGKLGGFAAAVSRLGKPDQRVEAASERILAKIEKLYEEMYPKAAA